MSDLSFCESERCEVLADYIIKKNATVRSAAGKFGISKSTVHKDVTERLKNVNRGLYNEVKEILEKNKAERHLRGGEATKMKYLLRKKLKLLLNIMQLETKLVSMEPQSIYVRNYHSTENMILSLVGMVIKIYLGSMIVRKTIMNLI